MRPIKASLFIGLLLTALACQDANQKLYDEVMAIHDEVMPRMDDLYKAKTALQKRLEASDLSGPDSIAITEKIAQLEAASEGMMVWMREFNPPPDTEGKEKVQQYLEAERIKVQKVRRDILTALESATE